MGFLDKAKAAAADAAAKTKEGVADVQTKRDLGKAYGELGEKAYELAESGAISHAELAPIVDPKSQGMNVSQRARLFVDAIAAICRDCNVPASLADVGIARSDLKKLAEDAMKQTRLLVNNPREVSFDDALAIYTEAFGNRAAA